MEVVGLYECPAHPAITRDKPGKCSVCGSKMNLSPKEKMKMEVMKPIPVLCTPKRQVMSQVSARNAESI